MTIIIFIAVLVLLILVHELGHFLAAKFFKIRVDEFGIGFPPRLTTLFWWGETRFTLNAIPFGGFVKIFGEDPDEESIEGPERERSFVNKNRAVQAIVLTAGVFFNALLALIFITLAFTMGMPVSSGVYDAEYIKDPKATVVYIMEDSPALSAGFEIGDVLLTARSIEGEERAIEGTEDLSQFLAGRAEEEVTISYIRHGEEREVVVVPMEGVIDRDVAAVGLGINTVGIVSFPPHLALIEGTKHTVKLTGIIAVELVSFIKNAITGQADFSEVAGPVGIVGLVGDAWAVGFAFLLYFTAIISLHLTIINLFPFPALDGGRLLFVAIESVTRRTINPQIANALNGIGFVLLIILMIAVTASDISKLFG